jgi:hypothetical protein
VRRRALPALVLPALLLPALAVPGAAPLAAQDAGAAAAPDAGGAVLDILPPGARGNVDIADLPAVGLDRQADGDAPANFADQLEMYDAINTVDPASITDADLPRFFKESVIDLPADQAVSEISPRPGVTIRRDAFGVPFVTGVTAEDVAFGAGYAGTEDRMFLTDLLRHVGAARTAEFLGGSEGNIAMDRDQLRIAAYTREEAEAQLDRTLARYPEEGADLLRRLDAFLEGINAAQRALCPGAFGLPLGAVTGGELDVGAGLGRDCPVEYAVLESPPTDFVRSDIVYIASLVGGIFGKGGGTESVNGSSSCATSTATPARVPSSRTCASATTRRRPRRPRPRSPTRASRSTPPHRAPHCPTSTARACPAPARTPAARSCPCRWPPRWRRRRRGRACSTARSGRSTWDCPPAGR